MVINTWNFTKANSHAWRILNRTPGGLGQTRNAVVEGCNRCEKLQCDLAVGLGGSPDEAGDTTLDAMIMDGATMNVGAVAGLRYINDAIRVARVVLEHTKHSMLVGNAATEFAQSFGFQGESLKTTKSNELWRKWIGKNCQPNFWNNVHPDPKASCGPCKLNVTDNNSWKEDQQDATEHNIGHENHDTIGMIAIDVDKQIHAGTSTNGLTFKIPGRVGDTAFPGAGAYADNEVGAATATGNGDVMMRFLPSLIAVEAMRSGKTPAEATELAIQRIIKHYKDFSGALAAVNRRGEYALSCYGWKEFSFVVSSPVKSGPNTRIETVKCLPKVVQKVSQNN
ncbi:uncharacterized protein Dwil_GK15948 [Drosophila willistoni]|uniref:N(4)-(beta-N-acetylglucosaminyl)-L-asparaginase n=2 Tax=Drosophila willistoni TaxID=7260 RepID=B4MS58_DROWI|nr:uncharacterized protein Dwil_GK15948 [Drosophila willistoni]